MIINPIIPVWLMAIICIGLIALKRKGVWPYIRQIIMVILIFVINLRPMIPGQVTRQADAQLNVSVLFVVDDTISMLARDYAGEGERLTAAKEEAKHIVEELRGAKFSVLAFNNSATILSPFTDNEEHIVSVINSIYTIDELYSNGSSMNTPIKEMQNILKRQREKTEGQLVVFFLSDGEITDDSRLESYGAIKQYVDGGAVMGYGTEKGGNMYIYNEYLGEENVVYDTTDYKYEPAVSRIDEKNLKQIAGDLGVTYIHMDKAGLADSIVSDIRKQASLSPKNQDETMKTRSVYGAKDIYFFFAIPLALLLIYEAVRVIRKKN